MKIDAPILLAIPVAAGAQMAPKHYRVEPAVYKVIAENERFRVIEATWQAGQRDAWHSHSGMEAAYRLTDCTSRIYTPDGKYRDVEAEAGSVNFNPPIGVHSFEKRGPGGCRALIVERK